MIKMLQYKMYPAGELRCPTTALVYIYNLYIVIWIQHFWGPALNFLIAEPIL